LATNNAIIRASSRSFLATTRELTKLERIDLPHRHCRQQARRQRSYPPLASTPLQRCATHAASRRARPSLPHRWLLTRAGGLYVRVNEVAALLRDFCGLNKGDRVTLHMPMVPELPITMLACARLGVIHSQVFSGFSDVSSIPTVVMC
jgi:non-ribosomal peptide synthetase component E (peptide arylation enzyme)